MKRVILLALFMIAIAVFPVQAATTDEATESAQPSSSETTKNLKERIERVVKDKQDQIKGVIDTLSSKKRGFIGQVQRVSQEALTVKNPNGVHIISITDQVEIKKSGKSINIDDVAVDEWALIIGEMEDDTFTPSTIEISTTSLRPKTYTVILGSVEKISSGSITIVPRATNADTITFDLKTSTEYQDLEKNELSRTNITEDMQVLLVGYQDDDDNVATTIQTLTVEEDE